jgi:hypothetical protein
MAEVRVIARAVARKGKEDQLKAAATRHVSSYACRTGMQVV